MTAPEKCAETQFWHVAGKLSVIFRHGRRRTIPNLSPVRQGLFRCSTELVLKNSHREGPVLQEFGSVLRAGVWHSTSVVYRHIRNYSLSNSKTFQHGNGNGSFGAISSNDFQDGNWESLENENCDCGRQDGNGNGN